MPNKTIGALNALVGSLAGEALIEVEIDGASVKVPLSTLKSFVNTDPTIVPSSVPYRGARVRLSSDFSPPTSSFHTVSWGVEDRDTDGFWSLAQPTRFVIPAGVTKIRLTAYVRSGSGANNRSMFFKRNGAYFIGGGGVGDGGLMYDQFLVSDVIDVVAGNFFEFELFGSTAIVTGGAGSPAGLATWWALEVIEASI